MFGAQCKMPQRSATLESHPAHTDAVELARRADELAALATDPVARSSCTQLPLNTPSQFRQAAPQLRRGEARVPTLGVNASVLEASAEAAGPNAQGAALGARDSHCRPSWARAQGTHRQLLRTFSHFAAQCAGHCSVPQRED
jgi:hypothetical protein